MKIEFTATIDVKAETIEEASAFLEGLIKMVGAELVKARKIENERTIRQNSALHLWFQQLATALNDAGFDMKKTLKQEVEIPWSAHSVKEQLWRTTQEIFLGKKSTKSLSRDEVSKIYNIIDRTISQRTGVQVDFPSLETLWGTSPDVKNGTKVKE